MYNNMYNNPLFWKLLCAFLASVIILQQLLHERRGARHHELTRPLPHVSSTIAPLVWTYDWERDRNDLTLTEWQCYSAFPQLYEEIDRAVSLWSDREHKIREEDIDISWRKDAAFKVMIHEGQVWITETRNTMNEAYRIRTLGVLHQIHRAVAGAAPGTIPTIEFSVTVDDMSLIPNAINDTHTIFSFARRLIDTDQERVWLIPDFNFWTSPTSGAFADMQRKARDRDAFITDKVPTAVWRGVRWTNEFVRGALLNITEGKEWADVAEIDWKNKTSIMNMEDMCKSTFVVHTEGRSWSGRLKYILNCDSVPVVHKLAWAAHYYHLLVPEGPSQNHIPVKADFSDLVEKVEWYLERPEEMQRIADNSVATFREKYTTPAAETCYWRRLFDKWSTVAWPPEVYENATIHRDGLDVKERRMRGITFEEFASVRLFLQPRYQLIDPRLLEHEYP